MYVSLDAVVSEAISVIGLSGDDELAKNFCRQWIWRCISVFPVTDDMIEVSKVDMKNLIIKKPPQAKRILEVALYDSSDNFIPHVFHSGKKRIYPDVESYSYKVVTNEGTDDEETTTYYLPVDLSEDDKAFYVGTNGENSVSYAQIRYFKYTLDNSGMPLIREEDVLTCVYYCRFMFSLRKNENQSEIRQNEMMYKQEADIARARRKSADISDETRKAIAANWNKMIPNFNRSRF